MSNLLGGKQGTAYLGTNANQPPNYTFSVRDPNQYDINNVTLGDLWLNETNQSLWVLVSLAGTPGSMGSLATWSKLEAGGMSTLDSLTGNTGGVVMGDSSGNINIVGDGIGITINGNPGTHTLTASLIGGGTPAETFPTDSGTATPVGGVLNIKANNASDNSGSTVSFSATGDSVVLNVTDANDNTIIGKASGGPSITGGDNTVLGEGSAFRLTSGNDNTVIGNTAATTLTSGSDNIVVGSGAGSTLTTNSSNTLIGNTGVSGATSLAVVAAGAGGTTVFHNFPGTNSSTSNGGNTFVGANAGNFTLAGGSGNAANNAVGDSALSALTTGNRNDAIGAGALSQVTTGTHNVALGFNAGFGDGPPGLITGSYNILLGANSASAYVAAESSNIIIGNAGVVSENNVIRIGTTGSGNGQQNKFFAAGIHGVTPDTADGIPLYIGSNGQLGTVGSGGAELVATVTGNTGGAVSPLAGNINIVGDGTTIQITGNPATHTLTVVGLGGGGGDLSILTGDSGSATAAAGTINVITNNSSQGSGSSVLFTGSSNNLVLSVTDSNTNTIIGNASGNATLSGSDNVVLGSGSGIGLTSGSFNTMISDGVGTAITSGSHNNLIGFNAGANYTGTESSNILIGAFGTAAESNVLRIGDATGSGSYELSKSFIQGIRGVTPDTADGVPVFIGSTGQLGTAGNGGTVMVQTITGNTGGAVGPALGNINIVGDGTTIEITGNPGTNTLTVVGLGGGGGDLSILTGDSGSATASAGTINVITNNSAQGAGSSVLFTGSSNNLVLTVTDSNSNTIIGNGAGKASITGTKNSVLGKSAGSALTTGASNIFIGNQTGNLVTTGTGNFLCGDASLNAVLQGTTTSTGLYGLGASTGSLFLHNFGGATAGNTFVGYGSGSSFNTGQQSANKNNTACGINSLQSITTASTNVAIGRGTGSSLTTGTGNTLIGNLAGSNYTAGESNNIMINNLGTAAESNVLRIGGGTGTGVGQVNKTFISGIRGITTGVSNAIPVVIDSNGQLGTAGGSGIVATLTGNSGGAVSATAGNINIVGDGVSVTVSGNPGTSTLTISASGQDTGASFAAYLTTTISGIIQNNTPNTIIYDTLDYNQGSAFNISTGIFTAPTTGMYNFSLGAFVAGTSGALVNPPVIKLVLSNGKTYTLMAAQGPTGSANASCSQVDFNVSTSMTSGDTAKVTVQAGTGGLPPSNTLNVVGTSGSTLTPANVLGILNFFSGRLI